MIPTEHLTVGGATSAAIALIGSVFNAIRSSSNSLTSKTLPSPHIVSQFAGPLRRQEASKQPDNTSCHLPLCLKPHLHLPGSSSECTGNAETHVGLAIVLGNENTAQVHGGTSISLPIICLPLLLEFCIPSFPRGECCNIRTGCFNFINSGSPCPEQMGSSVHPEI